MVSILLVAGTSGNPFGIFTVSGSFNLLMSHWKQSW
jgi:hypothetical protein